MKSDHKYLIFIISYFLLISVLNAQWIQKNFPSNEKLFRVKFANELVGWVLGENNLYLTTDGGETWTAKAQIDGGYGRALYCMGDNIAFYSDDGNGGIYKTTNAGDTWTRPDPSNTYYRDIEFLDENTGFVVGGNVSGDKNAIVKKTTDGGNTWSTVFQKYLGEDGYLFNAISTIGANYCWVLSYQGYVHRSTDGGATWQLQDSLGRSNSFLVYASLSDMQFTSADSGWAVGGVSMLSVIQGTSDGGSSWEFLAQPDRGGQLVASYQEVEMINSQIGWIVGQFYGSDICVTTDGGVNWSVQNPNGNFNSIDMLDINTGWIVGYNGSVYKTTNSGGLVVSVRNDEDKLASNYSLFQNYPNPFNPATTIEFNIPVSGKVRLSIFNLIGQQLDLIVNKELDIGNHKVSWNAKNYPSGIYFYKIEAGNFVETKSMILLK